MAFQSSEPPKAQAREIPVSPLDPGALSFWIAVLLTGIAAGVGAAALTAILEAVQALAWGEADPAALMEAAATTTPAHHLFVLLAAGLITGGGQWGLSRLSSGGVDLTAAIWFHAGRLPKLRTLGSAVLSIAIVGMGASLGREGAPKQAGAVFGDLASDLFRMSDARRRLLVTIGAGAGMAAVYSVPLGGALFALEVLRGALALRLVVPALAASAVATAVAALMGVPNAPIYATVPDEIGLDVYLWAILAGPFIGLWSVVFVRAIAWADRRRPFGWLGLLAPPLALLAVGAASIPFPEVLGNGQGVAQLLFERPLALTPLLILAGLRPLCTVASFASGAPGGLFTPSLAAGALLGAVLGAAWVWLFPGGNGRIFAVIGAGAMIAATTQGPISALVLMMELTGQARLFALPTLIAIVVATATARAIEMRSIYEARLSDAEVMERMRARDADFRRSPE